MPRTDFVNLGTFITGRAEHAPRWALIGSATLCVWAMIALLFSAQAYAVALYRGTPQPWWPSFGYSLAVFSIWALLTAPLALAVRRAESVFPEPARRFGLYILGLPLASALHVGLFVLIYWPVYNDGGRIASRGTMAEKVLLANFDTNVLFYALLVGATIWAVRRKAPAEPSREHASVLPGPALAAGADPRPALEASLTVRSRGGFRVVPLTQIDWVETAGNYCEVHAGSTTHLLDEPLTSLAARLPEAQFARIHRRAMVRLDRVMEMRGVGRGDALVRLTNGTELRLSRRYRDGFQRRAELP